MIAEYFHCTTALSESVGKIGSASKHQVSFSIPQQFRSTNIRFDEITVGYLRDFELFLGMPAARCCGRRSGWGFRP